MIGQARDLRPIKARWAAATPGTWRWYDEVDKIPYDETMGMPGNDGSRGVVGLFIDIPDGDPEPVLEVDVMVADLGTPPDTKDRSAWRGLIQISNPADLTCTANAKDDVVALIAEIEQLRARLSTIIAIAHKLA